MERPPKRRCIQSKLNASFVKTSTNAEPSSSGTIEPAEAEQTVLLEGDCAEKLSDMADESFQCCITSPPYWGMRDYGVPGCENDLNEYLSKLVQIFAVVRRKLTNDGTLWLNIGDTYTSGNRATRAFDRKNPAREMNHRPPTPAGLKPKDLVGLPWRLAFALQSEGWYLRSDIIWEKPNCQPESVKDRPTRSHEYVFLFSKSKNYYYDAAAVQEPSVDAKKAMRNRRTVWKVNTKPYKGAHFATFPEELVDICLKAGTKEESRVLDPFCGTGTVGAVCKQMSKRNFVGIELNPEYIEMARERILTN
ncbi:N(4) N(6)-methyltransferase [Balamuthia mandrillaris]